MSEVTTVVLVGLLHGIATTMGTITDLTTKAKTVIITTCTAIGSTKTAILISNLMSLDSAGKTSKMSHLPDTTSLATHTSTGATIPLLTTSKVRSLLLRDPTDKVDGSVQVAHLATLKVDTLTTTESVLIMHTPTT